MLRARREVFYEGSSVLFRMALSILRLRQDQLEPLGRGVNLYSFNSLDLWAYKRIQFGDS